MIDPIKRTRLICSHLQRESLSRSRVHNADVDA
jgi:hypothetical protein